MASSGLDETAEERRLRHAACLLADIGWRAHPDYRGEQSLNIIANAAFVAIDHPGRAFLALAVFFRHVGLVDDELSPHAARACLDPHARPRARARRCAARRLSGVGLDAGRAAAHADGGRARQADARCAESSRRWPATACSSGCANWRAWSAASR